MTVLVYVLESKGRPFYLFSCGYLDSPLSRQFTIEGLNPNLCSPYSVFSKPWSSRHVREQRDGVGNDVKGGYALMYTYIKRVSGRIKGLVFVASEYIKVTLKKRQKLNRLHNELTK